MAKGVSSMAWSPRGDAIAFTTETLPGDDKKKDEDAYESDVRIINQARYRHNGEGYPDPARHAHIWTVSTAGEKPQPRQITSGEFDEEDLAWSPDASRIYLTSTRVREPYYELERSELYAVPAGGGDITRVAAIAGQIGRIAPSPDGKWLGFAGVINTPARSYNQPDLFVVATTPGATPRNLTASYDYAVLSGPGGDQRAPRGGHGSSPMWTTDFTRHHPHHGRARRLESRARRHRIGPHDPADRRQSRRAGLQRQRRTRLHAGDHRRSLSRRQRCAGAPHRRQPDPLRRAHAHRARREFRMSWSITKRISRRRFATRCRPAYVTSKRAR